MKVTLAYNQQMEVEVCIRCYGNKEVEKETGVHGQITDSRRQERCSYCDKSKEATADVTDNDAFWESAKKDASKVDTEVLTGEEQKYLRKGFLCGDYHVGYMGGENDAERLALRYAEGLEGTDGQREIARAGFLLGMFSTCSAREAYKFLGFNIEFTRSRYGFYL